MAKKVMRQAGRAVMERTHTDVIKRYHTLCRMLALEEWEREALLAPYGVSSSKDMQTQDLIDVCGYLSKRVDDSGEVGELNKLRRRVMAAISSWLKSEGRPTDSRYIQSVACRVTGYKAFSQIPRERLRNLIGLMGNKARDKRAWKALLAADQGAAYEDIVAQA